MTTVRGIDELQRKLGKLTDVGKADNLRLALSSGGLLIANRAKQLAPIITGTLRRSIHVGGFTQLNADFRPGGDAGGAYTDLGDGPGSGRMASVLIGTNLVYAAPVEMGTSRRAAKPYLRPAFDQEKQAAQTEVAAALKVLVEKAASE